MRILVLSDTWAPEDRGGASIIAGRQVKGLQKLGNDVFVVATTRNKNRVGEFNEDGVRGVRLWVDYNERWRAYKSLNNRIVVRKVKEVIYSFKPDVVQAHNIHFYLSYACLKIAKKFGSKVFLTAHDVMMFSYGKLRTHKYLRPGILKVRNEFDYKVDWWDRLKQAKKRFNPFREIIIRYYLGYVDSILVVSKALKEALRQNGIYNTEVVYNGIDVNNWLVNEERLKYFRDRNGLNNKKIVLYGGRLSEAKGEKQIKEAMELVRQKVPEVQLVVFGGKVEGEGVSSLGWIEGEDLKLAYRLADIAVVPSVCFDSLPTVILEAMASAKPVVATQYGGSREMVIDGETGFIVNPFDYKIMSEKIISLLLDKKKSLVFGEKGYNRVKNFFNLDGSVSNIMKCYSKTAK